MDTCATIGTLFCNQRGHRKVSEGGASRDKLEVLPCPVHPHCHNLFVCDESVSQGRVSIRTVGVDAARTCDHERAEMQSDFSPSTHLLLASSKPRHATHIKNKYPSSKGAMQGSQRCDIVHARCPARLTAMPASCCGAAHCSSSKQVLHTPRAHPFVCGGGYQLAGTAADQSATSAL